MRRLKDQSLHEDNVTRERFCPRHGRVTDWMRDEAYVLQCIDPLEDGKPCLFSHAGLLSEAEEARLSAYVAEVEDVRRYLFT